MKQDALNKLKTGNVAVYLEFADMDGVVYESVELARFRNKSWAESFIVYMKADEEKLATPNCIYTVKEVQ